MVGDMITRSAEVRLAHPPNISRDAQNDDFLEDVVFSGNLARLFKRIRTRHAQQRALAG
jgi:hypothetical protein